MRKSSIDCRVEISLSIFLFRILKIPRQLNHVLTFTLVFKTPQKKLWNNIEHLRTIVRKKSIVDDIRMYDILQIDDKQQKNNEKNSKMNKKLRHIWRDSYR